MNVQIEQVNSITRKITVELPEEAAQTVRKKHLDNYARKARLKGFRPGKAPRSLVAKIYAEELNREMLEELISAKMPEVLEQNELAPIGMPQLENVDYEEGKPFIFTVLVELKPEFTSPQWQGLKLEKLSTEINSEAVDARLEDLRLRLSTVIKSDEDRPLVMGDLVNITYTAIQKTATGEKELDLNGGPFNIELGRDGLIEGFSEGMVGARTGETREVEITMPKESGHKKLAGKKVILRTTVNEIQKRDLPALDDELAKDLGLENVNTLSELKEHFTKELQREKEDQNENLLHRQLTQILANAVEIDVPSAMLEREISNKISAMQQNFARNGLSFDQMGVDMNLLRERFRPQAVKSVTAALVLDQIGQESNVSITSEEMDAELVEISREYGQSLETIKGYYQSNNLMDNLREGLKIAKTLNMIKDAAEVVEVENIDTTKLGYESADMKEDGFEGDAVGADGTISEAAIVNQIEENLANDEDLADIENGQKEG